tara:strand:+ start:9125 stop:9370 length:246 start_codon:yes stop_codon:yes gene_type:complete
MITVRYNHPCSVSSKAISHTWAWFSIMLIKLGTKYSGQWIIQFAFMVALNLRIFLPNRLLGHIILAVLGWEFKYPFLIVSL